MKYKTGDRVKIKSLDWYNKNKGNVDKTNSVWCKDGGAWFFYHMSQHCGKIMTIKNVWVNSYTLEGSDSIWTDEMIEGLVEEKCDYVQVDNIPDVIQSKTSNVCSHNGFYGYSDSEGNETSEWYLPEGYQFVDENGNVINATKIVLEKKKKEYPKTYEECCEILDVCSEKTLKYGGLTISNDYEFNLCMLLDNFRKLLFCRDAYWKIAGEEMGLGKPWEPDWTNNGVTKYCIGVSESDIQNFSSGVAQYTLAFPTAEMRDAFYENFKELIEQCKELL